MYLFLKRFPILAALLIAVRVDAAPMTNLSDFLSAVKDCSQLGDSTIEFSLDAITTIIVSADPDPKGYCIITVKHSAASANSPESYAALIENPPAASSVAATSTPDVSAAQTTPPVDYKCPLSKADGAKLSTPAVMAEIQNVRNTPGAAFSPEVNAALSPILNCMQKSQPKVEIPDQTPPAGAVPAGTPLPLPSGVVAAPGTVPPGTPPGMIPTSAVPAVTAPAATAPTPTPTPTPTTGAPANTTN